MRCRVVSRPLPGADSHPLLIFNIELIYKRKLSPFPKMPKTSLLRPLTSKRNLQGFTLVEVGIAAVLSAAIAALLLSIDADRLRTQIAENQGQLLSTINNAVNGYEAANFNALVNHSGVAGVANAYAPTLAELSSLGYLSNVYSTQNLFGGGYAINLSLLPTGCIPVNCNVGGLVALSTPILGQDGQVDVAAAGEAMIAAGGDGGMSSAASPGTIAGPNSTWTAVNPMGNVSGIVAMRNGYLSSSYAAFVRRDGSLPMTGNFNLGGNNVTNTNIVSANGVNATSVNAANVAATGVNTSTLNTSSATTNTLTANQISAGQLAAGNATITTLTSGNINNGGAVSTNTVTAGGRISTNEYLQVNGIASEGSWCAQNGLIGQDGSGGLLSCESNLWGRFKTFENISTNESTVDYYCTQGDPTNPPGYNYAQWAIVCGSRFCQKAYNYGFGVIVESPGASSTQPYESDPSGMVTVACSR
jgi:type II secretory pathway pseudopilin PulG